MFDAAGPSSRGKQRGLDAETFLVTIVLTNLSGQQEVTCEKHRQNLEDICLRKTT